MRQLITALILILLPLPTLAADYPARIVGVTDGDREEMVSIQEEMEEEMVSIHFSVDPASPPPRNGVNSFFS